MSEPRASHVRLKPCSPCIATAPPPLLSLLRDPPFTTKLKPPFFFASPSLPPHSHSLCAHLNWNEYESREGVLVISLQIVETSFTWPWNADIDIDLAHT